VTQRSAPPDAAPPEVLISYTAIGQETLAAINDELTGARDTAPEISISQGPVGRETLALISEELLQAPAAPAPAEAEAAAPAPLAIFEMLTFVVQGQDPASLASEALRRRFVEQHLSARLPANGMQSVERIDVTPWTVRDTLVVRVWCKV
jgi:hypothetical protein